MKADSPTAAKQRGMAIISALLIAAVVAVLAAGMLTRQSLFTRNLESELLRVQGSWVLAGGVEISRQVLWEARQRDPLIRHDQPWGAVIRSAALSQNNSGFEGQLQDEQGKFNLRNLVNNQRVDDEQLAAFERLCALIGVSNVLAQRISQRVIAAYPRGLNPVKNASTPSRFDSGRSTSPGTDSQVQTAKQPMLRSLEDLRSVEGINERVLDTLAPYVTVLPASTWINGNTATAPVLAAYVPGLSIQRAQALIAERDGGQWFINRGDFVNRLRMPQLDVSTVKVGITSDWFRLSGQARRDSRRVSVEALLHQTKDGLPQVIWSRVGV